ncbi:SAM-dependent methyltransferase [Sinobaca qinghaiensis]|uniref:SAM-dependent methyltransferase n=1 Tax=Sinobaca qinghaiensis TaxID=342944 RepID=A0A419UZW3_9BACL|nr:class I SAM-dependent rRNA methyltransferase [Sinobaca qinghaiensis]RKD71160.1 SAM-dependent methyltransferase [Sinobaca qinghaiensis]
MTETMKISASKQAVETFQKGYPLIHEDMVNKREKLSEEGTVFDLMTPQGQFIAKAYYGLQNKGIGWILTNKKEEAIDQQFFVGKLSAALQRRKAFFEDESTTAFRIFNGEGDGIGGLTIDYFNGYYMLQWYSAGIYAFRSLIIRALEAVTAYEGLYEKRRFQQQGQYIEGDDFVKGKEAPAPLHVKENGMTFAVYLNDGAMVGIFLDQREARKRLRDEYSAGKTVLNTFSYTGAFSVAAHHGGAAKTVDVDVANRSKSRVQENFELNGVISEDQEIRIMDVFAYFDYAKKKNITYDVIVLDPPSFARTKKRTFSAAKDYTSLLVDAISIIKDGGTIIASTNFGGFGMKAFQKQIDKACTKAEVKQNVTERVRLPDDHPYTASYKEGDYLKVVFIEITK